MKFKKGITGWMILAGFVALLAALPAMGEEPVITARKAAEVNGTVITMMTLNNEYRQWLKQEGLEEEGVTEEEASGLKTQILDSLIIQELLYQECRKNNISADEQAVADSFSEVKRNFETEAEYKKALKDSNIQEEDLVNRIRRSVAINTLVDTQISQHVVITEDESRAYYDSHPDSFERTEKVRASHILVMVSQDAGEAKKVAAKEEILSIQKKIAAGEDFAKLAQEYSDGPSGQNGGELGYFERGSMGQEFEDAAFSLNPGEVSDVVVTQYGYHLIKVEDKIDAGIVSYETVKTDLEEFMRNRMISMGVSNLIEMIRKDAEINTYL